MEICLIYENMIIRNDKRMKHPGGSFSVKFVRLINVTSELFYFQYPHQCFYLNNGKINAKSLTAVCKYNFSETCILTVFLWFCVYLYD